MVLIVMNLPLEGTELNYIYTSLSPVCIAFVLTVFFYVRISFGLRF